MQKVERILRQRVSYEKAGRVQAVHHRLLSVDAIKALPIEHERNYRLEERIAALEASLLNR